MCNGGRYNSTSASISATSTLTNKKDKEGNVSFLEAEYVKSERGMCVENAKGHYMKSLTSVRGLKNKYKIIVKA